MAWQPSPEAVAELERVSDPTIREALAYALRHPCSGPGVERILTGKETQ